MAPSFDASLLAFAVLCVGFTWNALRPIYAPSTVAGVSFFAGWLTAELALHHLVLQAVIALAMVHYGAADTMIGRVALAIFAANWVGLALVWRRGLSARGVVEEALATTLGPDYADAIAPEWQPERVWSTWRARVLPIPVWHPEVERERDRVYFEEGRLKLRLDVYRRRGERAARAPVLLYVHGGAWVLGNKDHQGLPMLYGLAAQGWVGVAINYRLSPRATFPDMLVDVKRAIAWVRAHADELGVDPSFIVVAGGSAGGHLASLAALTAGRRELQPGFEDADTSVAACVSLYGVYDFTDRHGHYHNPGLIRLVERHVLKRRIADAPELYKLASPLDQVHAGAPPFCIIHGALDTLVPVEEARVFAGALRALPSAPPVVYIEVPGAQHAFEVFPSPRSTAVVDGVSQFCAWLYSRHLAARAEHPA